MSYFKSIFVGLGRALASPGLILLVFLLNFGLALPLAWAMRGQIKASTQTSLVRENLLEGFDTAWEGEFTAGARGIGRAFSAEVLGPLPMLANLERAIEGRIFAQDKGVLFAGLVYLLALALLYGGLIDRYAANDPDYESPGFMVQCGRNFFSFALMLAVACAAYWAFFHYVEPHLRLYVFDRTRDVTTETGAKGAWAQFGLFYYLPLGAAIVLIKLILDYARIATAVATQRGAAYAFFNTPFAIVRGLFFVLAHPIRTVGLQLTTLAFAGGLGYAYYAYFVYVLEGNYAGDADWLAILTVFGVGQLYLLLRLVLKLWLLASETHLFRASQRMAALARMVPPPRRAKPAQPAETPRIEPA